MRQVKIGDQVEYETWSVTNRKATIKIIEICKWGEKNGRSVKSCDLDCDLNIILILSDNHWCYIEQVKRIIKTK